MPARDMRRTPAVPVDRPRQCGAASAARPALMSRVGVVVIGRNEGERLPRCLASVSGLGLPLVYVDSDSTDGSVPRARSMECAILRLDPTCPLSAGRARNEGFSQLRQTHPILQFIQFVDGDSELNPNWLKTAMQALIQQPKVAIVSGRLQERNPGASIYNRLCDMEWDTPVGDATECGGNAMVRVSAFEEVGGFDTRFVGAEGEEPELCLRLRRKGWRILRLDAEMGWHDAAMSQFAQWWKRSLRSGRGFAKAAAKHRRGPERYRVRMVASNMFWGLLMPLGALLTSMFLSGWCALILGSYPAMMLKIALGRVRRGARLRDACLYGIFTMLGKIPSALGQALFWGNRPFGRSPKLIEWRAGSGRR